MRNLVRCLLWVLAVGLRQPDSTQVIPFKHALKCVRALVNFNMIAECCSHTEETMDYMKDYLGQFHQMKDIFVEFWVSNHTEAKIHEEEIGAATSMSLDKPTCDPFQAVPSLWRGSRGRQRLTHGPNPKRISVQLYQDTSTNSLSSSHTPVWQYSDVFHGVLVPCT